MATHLIFEQFKIILNVSIDVDKLTDWGIRPLQNALNKFDFGCCIYD